MLFKPWFNLQFKALLSLRFMVSPIKDTACWIPPSTPFQEEDILIRSLATCTQLTEEERLQLGSSQFVSAAAAIAKSESGCLSIREAFLGSPLRIHGLPTSVSRGRGRTRARDGQKLGTFSGHLMPCPSSSPSLLQKLPSDLARQFRPFWERRASREEETKQTLAFHCWPQRSPQIQMSPIKMMRHF